MVSPPRPVRVQLPMTIAHIAAIPFEEWPVPLASTGPGTVALHAERRPRSHQPDSRDTAGAAAIHASGARITSEARAGSRGTPAAGLGRLVIDRQIDTDNDRNPMAETAAEYNANVIADFRANNGRVGGVWEETPLLLLHHTGAKSGESHVNPIAYLPDDAGYLIWAANGGAPRNPAWYHNLKRDPVTRIEVGCETITVVAEEATGETRDHLFSRAAGHYPQLADVARKTTRVIPMVILTPRPDI